VSSLVLALGSVSVFSRYRFFGIFSVFLKVGSVFGISNYRDIAVIGIGIRYFLKFALL